MYSSDRPKPKQQMSALLEPRRLMSISGGVSYAPGDLVGTQNMHSFGFELMLPAGAQMPIPAPFAPVAGSFIDGTGSNGFSSADANLLEAQFARAIAQGRPFHFSGASADEETTFGSDPGIDHSAHVNTLASIYSELNSSTANSINDATAANSVTAATLSATDNATFRAGLDESTANAFSATTATSVDALNQSVLISEIGSEIAVTMTKTPTSLLASVAPAITLASSLLSEQATPISADAKMSTLPHLALQNIEEELLTIRNLANEMIAQLGRDIAIEMSHLQSDLGLDALSEQLTTHWDGWRSAAAVTGAAIATIVYVQSESDREKTKAAATFSTQLIQAISA